MDPEIRRLKQIAYVDPERHPRHDPRGPVGSPGRLPLGHRPHDLPVLPRDGPGPKNPNWEGRDRFILSKGHASPALYGVLGEVGYFPHEEILTFRKFNSRLQGHPECKFLPGVEISTGSLGQGLSVAHGMALGLKLGAVTQRVYCMVGDGELQEGQTWEAIMAAGHRKTDNLCAILDHNHLQIDGVVEEIKNEEPVPEKFEAFGWAVHHIDGHDYDAILTALEAARRPRASPPSSWPRR